MQLVALVAQVWQLAEQAGQALFDRYLPSLQLVHFDLAYRQPRQLASQALHCTPELSVEVNQPSPEQLEVHTPFYRNR